MRQYYPMLLQAVKPGETLPVGPEWVFQPKLDGYRMVAYVGLEKTWLLSKSGTDYADRYTDVVDELPDAVRGRAAVLDGEMVGLDARGRESFSELSKRVGRVVFCAFDVLRLDNTELISQPYHERRRLLEEILVPSEHIWLMPQYDDPVALLAAVAEQGLEGVVAKRLNSIYTPGKRSGDWRKQRLRRYHGFRG